MESLSGGFQRAAAFVTTASPLLVVDTELVIQDANPAYVVVMGRTRAELIGAPIFDAFPDNPDDRDGRGSRQLEASFEAVFRTAGTVAPCTATTSPPRTAGASPGSIGSPPTAPSAPRTVG